MFRVGSKSVFRIMCSVVDHRAKQGNARICLRSGFLDKYLNMVRKAQPTLEASRTGGKVISAEISDMELSRVLEDIGDELVENNIRNNFEVTNKRWEGMKGKK